MQPNWFTVPSVYCSRTSSLRVSGISVTRPCGVIQETPYSTPFYTATRKLDFELEMGVIISKPLPPGQQITTELAKDHIFGFVILNDWSSRDIQSFEMLPLGPFHSKGFMTSISPWIVTMEALECSETARTIPQNPPPLPHLAWNGQACCATFNIDLSVRIIRKSSLYSPTCDFLINAPFLLVRKGKNLPRHLDQPQGTLLDTVSTTYSPSQRRRGSSNW